MTSPRGSLHESGLRIVAIETSVGKRNLNMDINAQQEILNAYISCDVATKR